MNIRFLEFKMLSVGQVTLGQKIVMKTNENNKMENNSTGVKRGKVILKH